MGIDIEVLFCVTFLCIVFAFQAGEYVERKKRKTKTLVMIPTETEIHLITEFYLKCMEAGRLGGFNPAPIVCAKAKSYLEGLSGKTDAT